MRLIDADKLMEVVKTNYLKGIIDSPIKGMSIALDRIYDAPTVGADGERKTE